MFDKNVFWLIKVSLDLNTIRATKSGILTLKLQRSPLSLLFGSQTPWEWQTTTDWKLALYKNSFSCLSGRSRIFEKGVADLI